MNLNYYNPQDRYKQRFMHRMSSGMMFAGLILLCLAFGYWLGFQSARQEDSMKDNKIIDVTAERDQLLNTVTELKAEAITAKTLYEQMEKTYNESLPAGPAKDLMALVRRQLAEGMDPQRMAYLLQAGQPPRNCSDPQTKRFVVRTPAYQGADSQVNIDESTVIVKGQGDSAKNDKGAAEAWFDPSKTVVLTFMDKEGKSEQKSGILPIAHSMILGGREYRMVVEPGARSFAKVTYNSCDYP